MLATDLHARLNAIFADYNRSDAPGCTVAVSLRGCTVYRAAFGLASVEHAIVNLPATRMPIGSVSKQFTCAGILLLAHDGLVDLDDEIGSILPSLPEAQRRPTLCQLMNHTGGLRCYLDQWMFNGFQTMPPGFPERMQWRQTDANFAPGHGSSYCNGRYHDYLAPDTGYLFALRDVGGKLGLSVFGGQAVELEQREVPGALPLHADVGTGQMRFRQVNDQSPANAIEYSDGGPWQRAARIIGRRPAPEEIGERFSGSYASTETGSCLSFGLSEGKLVVELRGEIGSAKCDAETLAPDLVRFWVPGLLSGALARLEANLGAASSVAISTPRTRRTVFTQIASEVVR